MKTRTMPDGEYAVADLLDIKKMSAMGCACCGKPHTPDNPMEITGKCHKGPVYVAYWDGWLYFTCAHEDHRGDRDCRKPVCCVPVGRTE